MTGKEYAKRFCGGKLVISLDEIAEAFDAGFHEAMMNNNINDRLCYIDRFCPFDGKMKSCKADDFCSGDCPRYVWEEDK